MPQQRELEPTEPGTEALRPELQKLEEQDQQSFNDNAPTGDFSEKSLNNLVNATNKLLPAFDQEPTYPTFTEAVGVLPEDFVRVLSMFQGASNEAADQDVVDDELRVVIADITDDASLTATAAKIDRLSRDKAFKKWLKSPQEVVVDEPVDSDAEPSTPPTDEEVDALFEERL